jgi:hypothetical protein
MISQTFAPTNFPPGICELPEVAYVGSAQAHDLAIDRGRFRCRAMSAARGHIRRVEEPSALFRFAWATAVRI